MKRIISIILTLFMLLSLLFSCSKVENSNEGVKTTDPVETEPETVIDETETTAQRIKIDLAEENYEGYEYRILGNAKEYHEHWYSRDLYAEEQTGETINDAVYIRNKAIEDKYNTVIKVSYSADPAGMAVKTIKSGTDAYDLLSIQLEGQAQKLAAGGFVHDLKKLPNLNLDQPWWDQQANRQLSIGGRLFTTVSDLSIVDKDAVFIYLFNKDLIKDLGLEDPYRLVRENKWTIDKLYEMSKLGTKDINGDGVIDDSDRYGNLLETYSFYEILLSSGETFIEKDKDDFPVVAFEKPRLIQTFDKWIEIHNDRVNSMMAQDFMSKYTGNLIWDLQLDMLNEKRALFLFTGMNRVTMLRQMECNFGIIPMPKLDDLQQAYSNPVHPWCSTSVSIPITVTNVDRTSLITEALTYESYYTLRPAYYDISLKTKLARDEDSKEMMDIIFSTRTYDLGHIFNWGKFFDGIIGMANTKKTDYMSLVEKYKGKVETEITKTIEAFSKIE